jgi:hypothetical protein
MKESDYIDATNLAKARIAQNIIYDILAIAKEDIKNRKIALSAISKIVARIETKVASHTLRALKQRLQATRDLSGICNPTL